MLKILKYEDPTLYIFAVDEDPKIVDFLESLQELTLAAGHRAKVFINCPDVRCNTINYCMKLETRKIATKEWYNHNNIQLCVFIKNFKALNPCIVMKKIASAINYSSDNLEIVNKEQPFFHRVLEDRDETQVGTQE